MLLIMEDEDKPTQRRGEFQIYPNSGTERAMLGQMRAHNDVYNRLLDINRQREDDGLPFLTVREMEDVVKAWWRSDPDINACNAQSLQVTAKRVAQAVGTYSKRSYQYKTRLTKAENKAKKAGREITEAELKKVGKKPGFPRFKSLERYPGWGYKTYGDGWKIIETKGKFGKLRLTIGKMQYHMAMRGETRFSGTPKTAEIMRKQGKWFISVVFTITNGSEKRECGKGTTSFDWGVEHLLTKARKVGDNSAKIEIVENPRLMNKNLGKLRDLDHAICLEVMVAKELSGFDPDAKLKPGEKIKPTPKLSRLYRQRACLLGKMQRQRKDKHHKETTLLVNQNAHIGTESLNVAAMTRKAKAKENPNKPGEYLPNGARSRAGRTRGILDTAPSMLLNMLDYKAVEAGTLFDVANTIKLKPTQRCHICGYAEKKELNDRTHVCKKCGCTCGRDVNAALTIMRWMKEGDFWLSPGQTVWNRAGRSATRKVNRSVKSRTCGSSCLSQGKLETPPIAALAV
jgi:putative transposase